MIIWLQVQLYYDLKIFTIFTRTFFNDYHPMFSYQKHLIILIINWILNFISMSTFFRTQILIERNAKISSNFCVCFFDCKSILKNHLTELCCFFEFMMFKLVMIIRWNKQNFFFFLNKINRILEHFSNILILMIKLVMVNWIIGDLVFFLASRFHGYLFLSIKLFWAKF